MDLPQGGSRVSEPSLSKSWWKTKGKPSYYQNIWLRCKTAVIIFFKQISAAWGIRTHEYKVIYQWKYEARDYSSLTANFMPTQWAGMHTQASKSVLIDYPFACDRCVCTQYRNKQQHAMACFHSAGIWVCVCGGGNWCWTEEACWGSSHLQVYLH